MASTVIQQPTATSPTGLIPAALNARRLVWIRSIAVPAAVVCLLLARAIYDLDVPLLPVTLIVLALGVFNVWTLYRLREVRSIGNTRIFMQILVDVLALTGILYFTGGAANPFVFFFLLPLTIAATLLPPRYTWGMAAVTAACYTLLLVARITVPAFSYPAATGFLDLHVVGMWLGFVVMAGLIAHFVAAMAETLRVADRNLAALREQALRDERMLATATLAAGAAHELSTPLATMSVVAEELAARLPPDRAADARRSVAILQAQIERCKDALSVLSANAGVTRAEAVEHLPVEQFVSRAMDEVRRLRPGASLRLRSIGPLPGPCVIVDRTLRQALLNILHNAVDASPAHVEVCCDWTPPRVVIVVGDDGSGLTAAPSKSGGLGLGLFLSQASVRQHGGELRVESPPSGGTRVVMDFPLARLEAPAR